jgi:hypothetical protein
MAERTPASSPLQRPTPPHRPVLDVADDRSSLALLEARTGVAVAHRRLGRGTHVVTYTTTRDSEALVEHSAPWRHREAILATGSVSGEPLGEPSAELRAKLADSRVRPFTPFLSM